MNELSYGLIVEGFFDETVLREFVRRTASLEATVIVRTCDGVANLRRLFPSLLRDLEHVVDGKPVDKALVIRDSDGRDPAGVEKEMAEKIYGSQFLFPRGIQFCVAHQALEAWILADVGAINAVAHERNGRTVQGLHEDIERIVDPKDRLRRLLGDARLPYDPEVCREVAERADVNTLRDRCPSFRTFQTKVLDC